jgi:hypothetical protein
MMLAHGRRPYTGGVVYGIRTAAAGSMVVVNVELAASNDCATPEPGGCFESAGMGRAPPSAAAMLSESRLVLL